MLEIDRRRAELNADPSIAIDLKEQWNCVDEARENRE